MTERAHLPGVPAAGVLSTWEVARETGLHHSTLNRVAEACGWRPGSGVPLRWSVRDVAAIRIAKAIVEAGAGDAFPVVARTVLDAHTFGEDPALAGWVAYRRGSVRYGATPSEALGPLPGAVIARLKPLREEHHASTVTVPEPR